jgi:DNA-binding NarL/FixJ family response regulator
VRVARRAQTVTVTKAPQSATTVLVVDDDPGFGRAAGEMLATRGYIVLGQAMSAADAVHQCVRLRPDAVLLDVRLPDGNGFALAETLRGSREHLKILLTSTDPEAVAPGLLEQSGASGFVPKAALARTDLDRFLRC